MSHTVNLSEPRWRDVPSSTLHQISDEGNIRNKNTLRILKQQANRCGYMICRVTTNRARVTLRPHRLVALLFIANPLEKQQVNHIDGVKANNKIRNLEWCTNSENQQHAVANGLKVQKFGKDNALWKLSVDVLREGVYITTLRGKAEVTTFGLEYRNVWSCLKGKRKTCNGYSFKLTETK